MSEYVQAICPVCGVGHGQRVTEFVPGKRYMVLERENYWTKRLAEWPEEIHLGTIQEALGRNTFKFLGYYDPEDAVAAAFFEPVKQCLLNAVRDWILKGWLLTEEVEAVL